MYFVARLTIVFAILISAFDASAAKSCKETDGDHYPCCCVIGSTGTCESDANCKELEGTCVPANEHFRCTAGQNSEVSILHGTRSAKPIDALIFVQQRGNVQRGDFVPPPLDASISPTEVRKREGCPSSNTRQRAMACVQFPDRAPKQSEVKLEDGRVILSERPCHSIWYACEYEFPKDFEPAFPWVSSRARIGRGNAPPQDDYCTTISRSIRNETLIQDERKHATCLIDHGCTFKEEAGGARIGAVVCNEVSLERKRDLIQKSQDYAAANFGRNTTVTRFLAYKEPKQDTNVQGSVKPAQQQPPRPAESSQGFKDVATRVQVNPSSIWVFATNSNEKAAKCSINLGFSYTDNGAKRTSRSTAEPIINPKFDGVMHNISGAYINIQLEGIPSVSCRAAS